MLFNEKNQNFILNEIVKRNADFKLLDFKQQLENGSAFYANSKKKLMDLMEKTKREIEDLIYQAYHIELTILSKFDTYSRYAYIE